MYESTDLDSFESWLEAIRKRAQDEEDFFLFEDNFPVLKLWLDQVPQKLSKVDRTKRVKETMHTIKQLIEFSQRVVRLLVLYWLQLSHSSDPFANEMCCTSFSLDPISNVGPSKGSPSR